tara:strand:- start:1215 stop:1472 length:258 start_codon:yes stop_codon:yes gene_type:complete
VSQESIRQLLENLETELNRNESMDDETRALLTRLDNNIDQMLEDSEPNSPEMEQLIDMEARFAANHPVAERIVRELIATLSRIGI